MLNKIKARVNNKKGFTLVELIVVIVIILILAAVLVPNVTKYVANARTASLKSDASAILTQMQADCAASIATELGTSDFGQDTYKVSGRDTKKVTTISIGATDKIQYVVTDNEITKFYYSDGTDYIIWENGSWKNVNQS